ALTASYSGFVNGDTDASLTNRPSLTTTATAVSHVGSYSITANGAADPDYTISYVSGTLTVTPAVLTVIANNKNKVYGAALPAVTASYTGFVNGDSASVLFGVPSLATVATQTSPVGSYPITAAAGSLSAADYTCAFANGTLTITPSTSTSTTVGLTT